MKKTLLFGGVAMIMALTGCSTDFESKWSFNTGCWNLVTNVEDGTTTVSKGNYYFDLKLSSMKGIVETSSLVLNGTTVGFATDEMSYTSMLASNIDMVFKNFNATTTGTSTLPVNGNILATPLFYYPSTSTNYEAEPPLNPYSNIMYPVATYTVGSTYKVRTFQQKTYFYGETTTTYPQSPDPFTTKGILYGLTINENLETKDYTATITMYNAKFSASPMEPVKTQVVLKDLPIDFTGGVIKVNAENVIPLDNNDNPNPDYTLDYITFQTTSDDLTTARISYKVAGIYTGTFSGIYVITPSNTQTSQQ